MVFLPPSATDLFIVCAIFAWVTVILLNGYAVPCRNCNASGRRPFHAPLAQWEQWEHLHVLPAYQAHAVTSWLLECEHVNPPDNYHQMGCCDRRPPRDRFYPQQQFPVQQQFVPQHQYPQQPMPLMNLPFRPRPTASAILLELCLNQHNFENTRTESISLWHRQNVDCIFPLRLLSLTSLFTFLFVTFLYFFILTCLLHQ